MFDVDALRLLVLSLVGGMGATVLAHASRSLRGEPYRERFLALGAAMTVATAAFVLADHPIVLAATWIAVSRLAIALLDTGAADARSGDRARRAFLIGDAALVGALALQATDTAPTLAALGFVVAAISRSAVAPLHRWLPDSLGAPTPVSALLHAGVVGGGGILLISVGASVTEDLLASAVLVAVAAGSCLFAEAVMLTRPDLKGRLAWSTIAQMSFTLVLCGLGLHGAAALHLVAHGAFKGSLFLGSGTAVRTLGRQRTAPVASATAAGPRALVRSGLGLATAAAVVGFAGTSPSPDLLVPALLAWIAASRATIAWSSRVDRARLRAAGAGAAAAALVAFVGFTAALKAAVAPSLEVADPALSPWWVAAVLIGLAAVARTRGHLDPFVRPAGAPRPLATRTTRAPAPRTVPALAHPTPAATGA